MKDAVLVLRGAGTTLSQMSLSSIFDHKKGGGGNPAVLLLRSRHQAKDLSYVSCELTLFYKKIISI